MFWKLVKLYLHLGVGAKKKSAAKPKSPSVFGKKFRSTQSGGFTAGKIVLYVILFIYLLVAALIFTGGIFTVLRLFSDNDSYLYWSAVCIICSIWGILGSVGLLYQQLYSAKDMSILAPLPIKTETILQARFFTSYGQTLLAELSFFIVAFIVDVVISSNFSVTTLISLVICIAVSPAISMFSALVLAFLYATLVRAAGKYAKLLQIVLGFVLFIAYFYFVARFSMQGSHFEFQYAYLDTYNQLMHKYLDFSYPFLFIGRFMAGDLISLVFFLLIFAVLFAISFKVLAKSYGYVSFTEHASLKKKRSAGALIEGLSGKKLEPMYMHIAKKDFALFADMPMLAINVYAGLLVPIYLLFLATFADFNIPAEFAPLLIAGYGVSLCLFNTYTTSSINIEIGTFWVLRSLPISAKDLLIGKSLPTLIVELPLLLIFTFVLGITNHLDPLLILLLIIFSTACLIGTHALALILNLQHIRLDADSPLAAVKKNNFSFFYMLAALMFFLPFIGIIAAFFLSFNFTTAIGISALLYTLFAALLVHYLFSTAEAKLSNYDF